jgi:deoxyribodipyrimidine photo-lyase
MAQQPVIVWFRRDLRLADNPALAEACRSGAPVLPVFIWAPEEERPWEPGAASRWWLHHSLVALAASLQTLGLTLTIRRGSSGGTLAAMARETGAAAVHWNRLYEPAIAARDRCIESAQQKEGVRVRTFPAHLMHEPWAILNRQDRPYQVFTPFYKACLFEGDPSTPEKVPGRPPGGGARVMSAAIGDLALLPRIDWAGGLREAWRPGERGARMRLKHFEEAALAYAQSRDLPGIEGTSRLSPHLHFGEISPRQVWHSLRKLGRGVEPYLRQLVWREFAHHLLHHFPHTPEAPLRPEFARFPWKRDRSALRAWQRGGTGFPIVDAGMRELWRTGWMHNRVRMVAASFLVKDLLIRWQEGARWFWDTLVDADLANNTLGWQWTAGCGADAAPYFRIFNPALQSAKFDPDGAYLRRWVPELMALGNKAIHAPHSAGVQTSAVYPLPIVDHGDARDRALEAYSALRDAGLRHSRVPPSRTA